MDNFTQDWEWILVDDASPDGSWGVMQELRAHDHRLRIVRLARNHGQQHATLCGMNYVRKKYVVTIDDDLQCHPEDIPRFIEQLESGMHLVIGKIPSGEKRHAWWRNIGSKVNEYFVGKILDKPKGIRLSSYRATTGQVAMRLASYKGAHPHITALAFKSVPLNAIANVEIRHSPRGDGGASSYSMAKLLKTLSYLLINHSYIPLRFMISWGLVVSVASLAYALWVLVDAIFMGIATSGWASLAILISFLSGNILLALGVVGEYLGRLVEESSNISQFDVFEEYVN